MLIYREINRFHSIDPIDENECISDTFSSENLKTLLRPVSTTLPHTLQIAEIELLSYGFENAKSGAIKILNVFHLCENQLIVKPQYDFGICTIKIVLKLCEKRKIECSDESEDHTIAQAIREIVLCTLIDEDIIIFEVINGFQLFPKIIYFQKILKKIFMLSTVYIR